jgi:nucleoside phosphorylase/Tfp pilus assembly protein PilF
MMDSPTHLSKQEAHISYEAKIVPHSEFILRELDLNEAVSNFSEFGKDLKRTHRVQYKAVINWLKSYKIPSGLPKQEQIRHLLESFYHLCAAEDIERAAKIFFIRINPPLNEELHIQLRNWAEYSKLHSICEILLRLLNSEAASRIDPSEVVKLKVVCLDNLGASEFTRGNCKSSQEYYAQQLKVSRDYKYSWGEASALVGLGNNLKLLGKHREAINQYMSAFETASQISNNKLKMSALSGLGNVQIDLGYNEFATDYFRKHLRIAEETSDDLGKVEALTALGSAYSLANDYELAIDFHLRALKITHTIENLENEAKILNNIGFTFSSQEEYKAAIAFYRMSLTVSQKASLFFEEAEALLSIGVLERKLATSKQEIRQFSLENLMQSLTRFETAGYPLGRARVLKELAETYERLGEIDLALEYCKQALEILIDKRMPLVSECEQLLKRYSESLETVQQIVYVRKFREIDRSESEKLKEKIEVVIITATDVELNAVLEKLQPYPRRKDILKLFEGPETYYIGKIGVFKTVVTKCRMGAIDEGSVILATEQAQRVWLPKAIIMVGIAFGKDPVKQNIGDVIVASQIISYENQRVGDSVIHRGSIPPSNTTLLNRFENIHDWKFSGIDGKLCKLHIGPVVSGEKLIDNSTFKEALFKQFPQAIGGEMEGAGLCAASGRVGTPWILVKSICDWADGEKGDDYHHLAASSATSLVCKVLSQKTVLSSIKKPL